MRILTLNTSRFTTNLGLFAPLVYILTIAGLAWAIWPQSGAQAASGGAGIGGFAQCGGDQIFRLWANTVTPTITSFSSDQNAIEVGTKFQPNVNGMVTGLRFYKGATNTGTHIGNLWTSGGTLLATQTYSGETASGWQEVA